MLKKAHFITGSPISISSEIYWFNIVFSIKSSHLPKNNLIEPLWSINHFGLFSVEIKVNQYKLRIHVLN